MPTEATPRIFSVCEVMLSLKGIVLQYFILSLVAPFLNVLIISGVRA